MNQIRRLCRLAVLAPFFLAGCDKAAPTAPPEPGTLTLTLVSPGASDRAILLEVTGARGVAAVEGAVEGYRVHSRQSGDTLRAAVFGTVAAGPLLRLTVADVGLAPRYRARVVDVSDSDNRVRENVAEYGLEFAR